MRSCVRDINGHICLCSKLNEIRIRMKALIVDDEPNAIFVLKTLFKSIDAPFTLVQSASGVEEGISMIESESFDFVFLDIKMNDGTGFDLLQRISHQNFHLIFTTAFDEFAIKAFKFSASDYLLKPIEKNELKETIEKCQNTRIVRSVKEQTPKTIDEEALTSLTLLSNEGYSVYQLHDITHIQSEGNYSTFFFKNGLKRQTIAKSLKYYDQLLCGSGFHRVHQSYLVNLREINKISSVSKGELRLHDGEVIPVSRRKHKTLIEAFAIMKKG